MSERAANPRRWRIAVSWAPAIVAVAALVGFAAAGQRLGWKVP
jgi:hypothetical protein